MKSSPAAIGDADANGILDWPYKLEGKTANQDPYPLAAPYHLSIPILITPTGGETLNASVTIQWTTSTDLLDHEIAYSVFYSADGKNSWILLATGLTNASFVWNTTTVANGTNYFVMVVVTCSLGFIVESVSGSAFTINNPIGGEVIPTETTTSAEEEEPEPVDEMIAIVLIILVAGIAALSLLYWRRRR